MYMPKIKGQSVVKLKKLLYNAKKSKLDNSIILKIQKELTYQQKENEKFLEKWVNSPQMEIGISRLLQEGRHIEKTTIGDTVYYSIDETIIFESFLKFGEIITKMGDPVNENLKNELETHLKAHYE